MIILGQSDDVTLGGDFEAAAAADFDVGTLKLGEKRAVALEHGHVEPTSQPKATATAAGVASATNLNAAAAGVAIAKAWLNPETCRARQR